jgi:hypothetical protein
MAAVLPALASTSSSTMVPSMGAFQPSELARALCTPWTRTVSVLPRKESGAVATLASSSPTALEPYGGGGDGGDIERFRFDVPSPDDVVFAKRMETFKQKKLGLCENTRYHAH